MNQGSILTVSTLQISALFFSAFISGPAAEVRAKRCCEQISHLQLRTNDDLCSKSTESSMSTSNFVLSWDLFSSMAYEPNAFHKFGIYLCCIASTSLWRTCSSREDCWKACKGRQGLTVHFITNKLVGQHEFLSELNVRFCLHNNESEVKKFLTCCYIW